MSKIREIRELIDTKLDKWEAGASALEEQLQQTQEQAMDKLEGRKEQLNDTVQRFKSEVDKVQGLGDQKKTEIMAQFDDLQVQLALGKTEARDAFEARKKKIQQTIATLEANVDSELDAAGSAIGESLDKAAAEFVAASIKLDAELDAVEIQFEMKKAQAKARFGDKKKELLAQINEYKGQLQEKTQMAEDKAAAFENEMSSGITQIKQAFTNLFDREK